jgi:hypothetical protein
MNCVVDGEEIEISTSSSRIPISLHSLKAGGTEQCNPQHIPRDLTLPKQSSHPPPSSVAIGVLNAQSVRNKSVLINSCILDNNLDLFAVVETWHDGADSPCLVACTPPNYKYVERARPRTDSASVSMNCNHGGICVFNLFNLFNQSSTSKNSEEINVRS